MTQEEMFKYLGVGVAGLMVVYLIVSVLDFNTNAILTLNKNSVAGIEGMTVREGMTQQEGVDKRLDSIIKFLDTLIMDNTTKINIDKNSRKLGDITDKLKEAYEKDMLNNLVRAKDIGEIDKLLQKDVDDKKLDKLEVLDKYRSLIESY
jgi:hypothetical protein